MTEEEREAAARAIIVESRTSLAIIRLNRPAERNQLSISTLAELETAVSALTERTDVSAIIITGTAD
ncbi:MAG TPA: hypothetical protein VGO69_01025, partial [Pyrinomonadaceae bacterium]|nr:hypothetical protein [Pyrinomonadaceae bacterium]